MNQMTRFAAALLAVVLTVMGCASRMEGGRTASNPGSSCHKSFEEGSSGLEECLDREQRLLAEMEVAESNSRTRTTDSDPPLSPPPGSSATSTASGPDLLPPSPPDAATAADSFVTLVPTRASLPHEICTGRTPEERERNKWKGEGVGCIPGRNFKVTNKRPGSGLRVIVNQDFMCPCGDGWWAKPQFVKEGKTMKLRADVIPYGSTARYFIPPGVNGTMAVQILVIDQSGDQGSSYVNPAPYLGEAQHGKYLNIPVPRGEVSQGISIFPETAIKP